MYIHFSRWRSSTTGVASLSMNRFFNFHLKLSACKTGTCYSKSQTQFFYVITHYPLVSNIVCYFIVLFQDINGIELLLRHHQIINNDDLLYGLSNLSAKLSNSFSKNPRFGKFLLGLAKKIPSTIPAKVHGALVEAVGLHLTFLKKTIELELKKRTVKYQYHSTLMWSSESFRNKILKAYPIENYFYHQLSFL